MASPVNHSHWSTLGNGSTVYVRMCVPKNATVVAYWGMGWLSQEICWWTCSRMVICILKPTASYCNLQTTWLFCFRCVFSQILNSFLGNIRSSTRSCMHCLNPASSMSSSVLDFFTLQIYSSAQRKYFFCNSINTYYVQLNVLYGISEIFALLICIYTVSVVYLFSVALYILHQ